MSGDTPPRAIPDLVSELRRKSTFSGCRYRSDPDVSSRCEGGSCRCAEEHRDQLEQAADALEALEKDAARYRWLRGDDWFPGSHRWSRWRIEHWSGQSWDPAQKQELDELVDEYVVHERESAALAAVKAQEEGK